MKNDEATSDLLKKKDKTASLLSRIEYINMFVEDVEQVIKKLSEYRFDRSESRKFISMKLRFTVDNVVTDEKEVLAIDKKHFGFLENFLLGIVDGWNKEIKSLEGEVRKMSDPLFKDALKIMKEQEKG